MHVINADFNVLDMNLIDQNANKLNWFYLSNNESLL
jgi:hypothetical protein